MKVQYVGHEPIKDKDGYRIFLLRQNEKGVGLKPMLKYAEGIGLYFPKVTALPAVKVGDTIEVFFDERGNLIFP